MRVRLPLLVAALLLWACGAWSARGAAASQPGGIPVALSGRTVEEVRILGRAGPLPAETVARILQQVRTREGEPFEPTTVEGDYQRIFELKRFANVEARVEPTQTGVIVIFEVTEQAVIKEIRYLGNEELSTETIQQVVLLQPGEAVDSFRLGLARESIVRLYQAKNLPYAHVEVDVEEVRKTGILTFNIIEGPKVRVRKVLFLGNKTYSDGKLKDQIKTKAWFPLFVDGIFDLDQIEQDVASVREYYQNHGFFDVRVGRRIVVSPNQKEVMVEFVVDEGPRYTISKVTFRGNLSVSDAQLREKLKLVEGMPYDNEVVRRDIREIVRVYSPLGFIYVPADPNPDPDYLRIREQRFFQREAGKVELVYDIAEGKSFELGRVIVKGNDRTQDKVVLRELRVAPGQLYDSAELLRAQERLRATQLYRTVTITPIPPAGAPPEATLPVRDLLVEVVETDTARFVFGASVGTVSGLVGQIMYEQRNFDISNWPRSRAELFSNRAFTGAGQTFRISLEPGTELTRARLDFIDPYIFDQNFSFGNSLYLAQRRRPDWSENRLGDRMWLGHRFDDTWSARIFLRGEQVEVVGIEDKPLRAPEILELNGASVITSAGLEIRRDTTDSPLRPSRGTVTTFSWEHAGAMGGDFDFDRLSLSFVAYTTLYEDLLDRRTILSFRTDTGYIAGDAPFFERFYAGDRGSVRGFRYRGISPRSGIDEDPVGGDFMVTGTVELNFPLAADVLRGVVFVDFGDVEDSIRFGTLRTSVGFGFRLTLPFLGQLPIAMDFGFPVIMGDQDDRRIFSFSLGSVQ